LSLNTRKVIKRVCGICGKNLNVDGEEAKRLMEYSPNPNTPRDIELSISLLKMATQEI
jgi:hypothetical protein